MKQRAARTGIARVPRVGKLQRVDVTRDEFNRVIEMLNERAEIINHIRRELELQFRRTAQIQAPLDRVTTIVERIAPAHGRSSRATIARATPGAGDNRVSPLFCAHSFSTTIHRSNPQAERLQSRGLSHADWMQRGTLARVRLAL